MNSQLSVAKYYGGIKINGSEFTILHDSGDLINTSFRKYYNALGRELFLSVLKGSNSVDVKDVEANMKAALVERKRTLKEKQDLFNKRQLKLEL